MLLYIGVIFTKLNLLNGIKSGRIFKILSVLKKIPIIQLSNRTTPKNQAKVRVLVLPFLLMGVWLPITIVLKMPKRLP